MKKDEIRSQMRLKRKELDKAIAIEHSVRIQKQVIALDEFKSSDVVACYMAMPGEVRTDLIISACRAEGKTVCLPAYSRSDKVYKMLITTEASIMGSGPMGISEPVDGEAVDMDKIETVIVPGVAFDLAGRRVGQGGGHYDRLLSGAEMTAFKLGLGYEFQMFDEVPGWEHDINMDLVITEDRTIRCPEESGF